jgi:cysteine desulfurase
VHGAQPINLDANASYGCLPEVIEGVREALGALNPSSIHAGGQRARALIERARDSVAALLGLRRKERIIFTSGATEANATALFSPFATAKAGERGPPLWLTSALEHHSVLEPFARLSRMGFPGEILSAPAGFLTPESVAAWLSPETRIISFMYANNETGHLSPISDVARTIKRHSPECLIHVDAVQLLGKSDTRLFDDPIDSASFSAHKIGGLSGVGALVIRDGMPFEPLLMGGAQEVRHRAGTENVPGIVAFGLAAEIVQRGLSARIQKLRADRRFVEAELRREIEHLVFNHPLEGGLPNTVNVTFPGLRADDLVVALDLAGVLVSSGAACASGKPEPSHVLKALGLTDEAARATIRISLRADHTEEELSRAVKAISQAVKAGRVR